MNLSRIAINKNLRKSRVALSFPQMMHAAVLDSFPPSLNENEDKQKARVLWRVDYFGEQTWLYVLSDDKPDFTHIVEQFGWLGAEQRWETKDYTPFLERVKAGQLWQFRLHANPVRTVNNKIYAHTTVDQQKEWLSSRAEKNGFELQGFEVIYRNKLKFRKNIHDQNPVTLAVATFEGHLVVKDADALTRALAGGIGRAKAYGCGLLTLAKAKSDG